MIYRFLADVLVLFHLTFIVFVIAGALLVIRWRWMMFFHIPATLWGALIELKQIYCPLTPLEIKLRMLGGQAGYSGGFIEHYIEPLVYPAGLTREIQIVLGIIIILLNLSIYFWLFHAHLIQKKE